MVAMRLSAFLLALAMPSAAADLVFQAREAGTLLVVHPDPEVGDLAATQVELAVLLRKGAPPRAWKAGELLGPAELRIDAGRVIWLAPSGSRTRREGAELRLASGRRVVLRFDGAGPQGPGPRVPVAPVSCPCCFVDDAGVYHVVSEVPVVQIGVALVQAPLQLVDQTGDCRSRLPRRALV